MGRREAVRVNREGGISLFEILITVIVVSIGLLGLAGLQFAGLRASNNAQEHTYASLLTQDIEERIRANPAISYVGTSLGTGGSAPTAQDCTTIVCTAVQMRDFDRRRWYFMINSGGDAGLDNIPVLPNAAISVTRPVSNFIITITWGDPSGPQSLTAQFSL